VPDAVAAALQARGAGAFSAVLASGLGRGFSVASSRASSDLSEALSR